MSEDLQRVLDAPLAMDRQRFDVEAGLLVGGQCDRCDTVTWPARPVCPRCQGTNIATTMLPRDGELMSWSRVWVPVEGIKPPYVLGLVQLGLTQVFGHVRNVPESVPPGLPVSLRIDDDSHPPFWFEVV